MATNTANTDTLLHSQIVDMVEAAIKETCSDGRTSVIVQSVSYERPDNDEDTPCATFHLIVQRYPPRTCESKDVPKALKTTTWHASLDWTAMEKELGTFEADVVKASTLEFNLVYASADVKRYLRDAIQHCDETVWTDNWKDFVPMMLTGDNADVEITLPPRWSADGPSAPYKAVLELALRSAPVDKEEDEAEDEGRG